ncbi:MAG: HAD family hydrolase [Candidatus Neomarinimicrobiota bacterium]
MSIIKAIIFDMDGTLVDSLQGIAVAMNRVLRRRGYSRHPRAVYREFVGSGIEMLVRRALAQYPVDADELAAITAELRDEYSRTWRKSGNLYDGLAAVLDQLTAANIRMAILSNKPQHFTEEFRTHFLARWVFNPVRGAQPDQPRKPDPYSARDIADQLRLAPDQILFVGDSGIDMETAVGAGMVAVGVSWGFRSRKELLESGADYIIDRPGELLAIIATK